MRKFTEWKDTTTYARGQEKIPTTYTLKTRCFTVVVTCAHIYYPDRWVLHAYPLGIDTRPMAATTLEEAQAEAIEIVRHTVRCMVQDLEMM